MKNNVLAVVIGIIAAMMVVMLGDRIAFSIFPPPENLDFNDPVSVQQLVDGMPIAAHLLLFFNWSVSAFVGGLVTTKLSKSKWQLLCVITGALLLTANILNMFVIPYPIWLIMITVLMYLPVTYLGGKLIAPKTESV
ncbi:MAG: hypothetical protein P8O05_11420 [Flavobacteriales bacterium]|nr:hypothetical protein [Flavobacteriales bacterium]MDG2244861.1 hypothetical protein [Flavobacteriales bacterium]